MLDRRTQTLLKVLVERYIAEGQPIGSRTLSNFSGLQLSPATIRHVMADLESRGLVSSPHTSAGRVPTPRGYRLFVDTLMTAQPLHAVEAQAMQGKLQATPPQKAIATAAEVLSNLSQFTGIVTSLRRSTTFKQIEFLRLSEKRILLIIVTPDNDVQNRLLLTAQDYTATQLIEAGNFINQHYAGLSFDLIRKRLHEELAQLRDNMMQLMQAAVDAGSEVMAEASDPVVIAGEHNLFGVTDLTANMECLRQLFELFEQKTQLTQLLDSSHRADGVQIFIGGDSQLVPLADMSVVTAPYEVDGQVVGTLGVIGPMRMAYERVVPIVDITAKLLSNTLSSHTTPATRHES